jgi:DNA-binding NarL/FixJ family response regulator
MTDNTSPIAASGQSRSISGWAPEAKAMRGAPHQRPTVIIADDHLLMAQGLAKLVEEDLDVLAVVGNGRELLDLAIHQIPAGGPNLALMDICMPELSGVETTRKLREVAPLCKVILISMHSQPEFIREAFRVGASGYLLKLSAASELMVAIREVMNGSVYVSSDIAKNALSSIMAPAPTLSPRQREVLRLVAEGCSAKEVAGRLNITVKTAQFHKISIMTKLGVHSTAELTKYALGHGIASFN